MSRRVVAVIWRDDGLWPQVWHVCCAILTRGRIKHFPPKGFVGQVYGSFQGTGALRLRVSSLKKLPHNPAIWPVRLWRLTYELETPLPPRRILRYGEPSDPIGNGSEEGGAGRSTHRTGIILTSTHVWRATKPPTIANRA